MFCNAVALILRLALASCAMTSILLEENAWLLNTVMSEKLCHLRSTGRELLWVIVALAFVAGGLMLVVRDAFHIL